MESAIEFPDFFTVKFNNHAKIDEKEPFVLYSITVHTNFSCYHIYKRYSDFSKLNDRIMAIKSEAENSTHHDCFKNLPAFHGSSLYYWNLDEGFIQERKGQLEKYSQSLLQFYHKFSDRNHHKNVMFKKCKVKSYKSKFLLENVIPKLTGLCLSDHFIKIIEFCALIEPIEYSMNSVKEQIVSGTTHLDLDSSSDTDEGETFQNYEKNQHQEIKILDTINEFFSVSEIFNIETTMTIKIQRAFRSSKFNSGLRKLKKSVYSCLGYTWKIDQLPEEMLLNIFTYLEKADLYKASQCWTYFKELSFHRWLWGRCKIVNQKKDFPIGKYLPKFLSKLDQLKVLDLSFWMSLDEKNIKALSPHVFTGNLKELYLDGCEKINDNALTALMGGDPNHLVADAGNPHLGASLKLRRIPTSYFLRKEGIELLSLNECRNIHWSGVMKLEKLKYLKTLNLLGCVSVKDDSIKHLNNKSDTIETLNLGGTGITSECIYYIVTEGAITLKNVNIVGCKKLKNSDIELLKTSGFNVTGGEDVFRFNLLPEPFSGLKKITQSVLKTRSTLSIFRVYKYLAKRLINELKYFPTEIAESCLDHDEFIKEINLEIHWHGVALEPQLQLKEVNEKFWNGSQALLTLYYRNKNEEVKFSKIDKELTKFPPKPPTWIPDKLCYFWWNCEKEFSFFSRVHHWRACGKCFCSAWSMNKIILPQYGYTTEVRVCISCYWRYSPSGSQEIPRQSSGHNGNSIIFDGAVLISPSGQNLGENESHRIM